MIVVSFPCPKCQSSVSGASGEGKLLSTAVCSACRVRGIVPDVARRHQSCVLVLQQGLASVRFSLIALLTLTSLACVTLAAVRQFGPTGVFFVVKGLAAAVTVCNLFAIRSAFGFRIPRLTVVDFLVVVAVRFERVFGTWCS